MKQSFSVPIWQEDNWFITQCKEVDVASQGETKPEAIANLKEALSLYFREPPATVFPGTERLVAVNGLAFGS
ncbi:MAG: type II toxin-antitoxin system HicB family antitoxin [Ferruginibacter sp.]|nr:type II toxin-antitoxin system HicB family antitoxin [Cytophagales bacterium]